MKRFRGGLVFKAHRLVHHSTLGSSVIKKKKKKQHKVDSRLFILHALSRDACHVNWRVPDVGVVAALEATRGEMDGLLSQLPYKSHLEEVASLED